MSFWKLNVPHGNIAMILPGGESVPYGLLQLEINLFKERIHSSGKKLGMILCQNKKEDIVAYIAALQKGDAVMLVDENAFSPLLEKIINTYSPQWIYSKKPIHISSYTSDGNFLYHSHESSPISIHPNLALLLATSGTTGSSKFVRLSYENLKSNAEAIVNYLQINESARPIITLPIHYSYGLSVINSHLEAGATILLTNESIVSKEFWDFFKSYKATSFAGVPYIYQMLKRLRFEKIELPSLQYFTQAGGKLTPNYVSYFEDISRQKGQKFFVMYGQTEATARISYVPPQRLREKVETIGIVIPGGELSIEPSSTELIYKGKNVMLGYAQSQSDLEKGDENQGLLFTGDLATIDEDGYFSIIGRKKRFLKLFGLRISLDQVEQALENEFRINVVCSGNDEKMKIFIEEKRFLAEIKDKMIMNYGLHHSSFTILVVDAIPRLANGKVDYETLKEM